MGDPRDESRAWCHAELWTRGHWLHGDPRGFRDRGHRIHSSGDYKRPPPKGEHAGLHRYMKQRMKQPPVVLSVEQRHAAIELLRRWFELKPYGLVAPCVGGAHGHLLCELPVGRQTATLGWLKKYVSTELGKRFPELTGALFAAGGDPKPVVTREHFVHLSHEYIVKKHAAEGAATWWCGGEQLPTWISRFEASRR